MTRDIENYGRHETVELCERCDHPPEPVRIKDIDLDALTNLPRAVRSGSC